MNIQNPIKHYLAQSVRTNGKWALIAWVCTLVICIILVTIRVLPSIYDMFSWYMIDNFALNFPLKLAPFAIPIFLFFKSQSYKEWQNANPDTPITKKEFATAIYLEIFLSIFLGAFTMGIIWIVAGLVDPTIVERIFRVGMFGLGEVFLWTCLMTAMVYTLMSIMHKFLPRTKKLKDVKDIGLVINSNITMITYVATLLAVARFQNNSWYLINDVGVPIPIVVMAYAFAGLIILIIGRTITAKLL